MPDWLRARPGQRPAILRRSPTGVHRARFQVLEDSHLGSGSCSPTFPPSGPAHHEPARSERLSATTDLKGAARIDAHGDGAPGSRLGCCGVGFGVLKVVRGRKAPDPGPNRVSTVRPSPRARPAPVAAARASSSATTEARVAVPRGKPATPASSRPPKPAQTGRRHRRQRETSGGGCGAGQRRRLPQSHQVKAKLRADLPTRAGGTTRARSHRCTTTRLRTGRCLALPYDERPRVTDSRVLHDQRDASSLASPAMIM